MAAPRFEVFHEAPAYPRLLIAEGDPVVRDALAAFAGSRGFAVHTAATGEACIALARSVKPDLIVLDAELPDARGTLMVDVLRNDVVTRNVSMVVMAENATVEREARRRGADDVVRKPVHPERFIAMLSIRMATARPVESQDHVVVVDDDPACRSLAEAVLAEGGYKVSLAGSAAEAIELLDGVVPDLLVMDVMMPGQDGITAMEKVREDLRLRHVPVVFLTALSGVAHKVRAFEAGADDYVVKPFDTRELLARVTATLRRARERSDLSPNTMLPGSAAINQEVVRRTSRGTTFAFSYVDVDNFKAFNDTYGYVRADGVIRQLAVILKGAVEGWGEGSELLGHVAGDDFVLVGSPSACVAILEQAIRDFDAVVPLHYDVADRKNGYIVAEDRFGVLRRFPLMSLSAVALACHPGEACDYASIADTAAALKKRAKKVAGSVLLTDFDERGAGPEPMPGA